MQLFRGSTFELVHRTKNVKAYLWVPGAMIGIGRIMEGAMAHVRGEIPDQSIAEVRTTLTIMPKATRLVDHSVYQLWTSLSGKLMKDPFAPPMYDYEYHPQEVSCLPASPH